MTGAKDTEPWTVLFHPDFTPEAAAMPADVQVALRSATERLQTKGPALGRPFVDTLNGSSHSNMKELRVAGAWRFAFAFDPHRRAVVLCGGSKAGIASRRFYRRLIAQADERFARWLDE